jgi:hypothetical protein
MMDAAPSGGSSPTANTTSQLEVGLGGHSEYPDELDGGSIEETNESYTPSDKRRAG